MKKYINLIFNNSYIKNKACRWILYYSLILGILDSIINFHVEIREMIPMFFLLGLLFTPIIGIVGSVYEKKKNNEDMWHSIRSMLLALIIFIPIYQITVFILVSLLKILLK